jgi:hypothetical protein
MADTPDRPGPAFDRSDSPAAAPARGGTLALFGTAALAAAALGWLLMHQFGDTFQPQASALQPAGGSAPLPLDRATVLGRQAVDRNNATLCLTLVGATLGGFLSLAAGWRSHGVPGAVIGAGLGIIVGAGVAALGALAGHATVAGLEDLPDVSATNRTLAGQVIAIAVFGAGVALAVSLAGRYWRQVPANLVTGIAAALVGLVLYQTLMAFLIPAENMAPLAPQGAAARPLWSALLCVTIGLGLGWQQTSRVRPQPLAPSPQ